jgi:hypothetical protein
MPDERDIDAAIERESLHAPDSKKNKKNIPCIQDDLNAALTDCVKNIGEALERLNVEQESLKRRVDALERGIVAED